MTEKTPLIQCECGSEDFIIDQIVGESVCKQCGVVASDSIVAVGEGITIIYGEHEDKMRTAPMNPLRHDRGLTTDMSVLSPKNSRNMSLAERATYYRLRRWHNRMRVQSSEARNISVALAYMAQYANQATLPRHTQIAATELYRKVLKKNLIRGRTISEVAAACMYIQCRLNNNPISLLNFCRAITLDKKAVSRVMRLILRELKLRLPRHSSAPTIAQLVSKLELPMEIEQQSLRLLSICEDKRITSGKDPKSMAAAIVYIVCRFYPYKTTHHKTMRTQGQIARITGVTEVTIRNRYKECMRVLDIEGLFGVKIHTRNAQNKIIQKKYLE